MIQGTEITAAKAALQRGSPSLANYVFPPISSTQGGASLMWNLGYPATSQAHIGVQDSKILD